MAPTTQPVGRNEKCPCGSGRKYKQCCLAADEEKARKSREKAAAKAAREAAKDQEGAEESGEVPATTNPPRPPKPQSHQPWRKSATNTHAFQRMTTPRKVGGG